MDCLSESIKKGKFLIFLFSDNVERSFNNLWEMISADVKANEKKQEVKDLVASSYKCL